jgi:hypothetical protein
MACASFSQPFDVLLWAAVGYNCHGLGDLSEWVL